MALSRTVAAVGAALLLTAASSAGAAPVGTSLPAGFPLIRDASLGVPVLGFGAAGPLRRTPVVMLHGNNDTPFSTTCNSAFGSIHNLAESLRQRGYAESELWGLGYQGPQCDILTTPTNKSGVAHSTLANVPDVRAFILSVLAYTGASQVDIVGHSLGTTVAREWMRQDAAYGLVRTLVGIDGPNHGIINCSPSPQNYFSLDGGGGFTPDSAVCLDYGSDRTPLLAQLNAGDETPGATRYVTIYNADISFVFFPGQDGAFPGVPAEDREGKPHDFSKSAWLDGAENVGLSGQGRYDDALGTAHLGIINSPEAWRATYAALAVPAAPVPAPAVSATPLPLRSTPRLTLAAGPRRDRRRPHRFTLRGRLVAGVASCRGTVGIRIAAGARTVAARLAPVRRDCSYATRVTFARRLGAGRLRASARFYGTQALAPARAPAVTVRAG